MQGEKINGRQAFLLLSTTIVATLILFIPSLAVAQGDRDTWLGTLLAATVGLVVVGVVALLAARFPDRNLFGVSEKALGRIITRGLVAPLYFLFFFYIAAAVLRELGDVLTASLMPETPLLAFVFMTSILVALAVLGGLEVVARLNEIVFLILVTAPAFILLLLLKEVQFENLLPALAGGFTPVIRAAVPQVGFFGEVVVLAFIIPQLEKPRQAGAIGAGAVAFSALMMVATIVWLVGIFGVQQVGAFLLPTLTLGRQVLVAGFLTGLDPLVVAVWVAGVTVKASVFFYVALLVVVQGFGLREYRPLVFPATLLLVALSILQFASTFEFSEFVLKTFPFWGLTMELVLPVVILLVAVLRGQRGEEG
mgnify:CR=1 FL=1